MSPPGTRRRHAEGGFSLIELLAAIGILGIIGFGLTSAVILGLKVTDRTADRISGSVAGETITSYFTGDVQSADEVSTTDDQCVPVLERPGVFLHLKWRDETVDEKIDRRVSYSLDPPVGTEQDLIRWACTSGSATPERRILGHLSQEPGDPPSVSVLLNGGLCPQLASSPSSTTTTTTTTTSTVPPTPAITLCTHANGSSDSNQITVRLRTS